MKCLKCGFENNEGNVVCTNCGNLLVENTNSQTTNTVSEQPIQTNIVSQPVQEVNTTNEGTQTQQTIQPQQQVTSKSHGKLIIVIIAVIVIVAGAFGIYKLFINNPSSLSYSRFEKILKKHGYKVEDTTEKSLKQLEPAKKEYQTVKNTYKASKKIKMYPPTERRYIEFYYHIRTKRSAAEEWFDYYCNNFDAQVKTDNMCQYSRYGDFIQKDVKRIILISGNANLDIEYIDDEDYDEVLKIIDELGFSKYMKK